VPVACVSTRSKAGRSLRFRSVGASRGNPVLCFPPGKRFFFPEIAGIAVMSPRKATDRRAKTKKNARTRRQVEMGATHLCPTSTRPKPRRSGGRRSVSPSPAN